MKKERIYYLDLIKVIAVIAVFVCHFSRSMEAYQITYTLKILPDSVFNIYLGSFGVTLFFIASGAALMYVYDEKINLKDYYVKRFLGIYPMFWIAYFVAFAISLFRFQQISTDVAPWKFIYSILGIDGNALWWGMNYYQLGEWFLSVIICMYIIFPLLRWGMDESIIVTCIVVVMAYVGSVLWFHTTLPQDCFFIIRIPEFMFGMIYMKYIKKTGLVPMILSVLVVAVISFLPAGRLNTSVAVTLVGISSFFVLSWFFQNVPTTNIMKKLSGVCAKYCYAFFLTHHYILRWMISRFAGRQIRKSEEIVIFLSCFAVVLIATKLLYDLHKTIITSMKKCNLLN